MGLLFGGFGINLIGSVVDGYFPNSAQCDKYNPSVVIAFYDWLEKNHVLSLMWLFLSLYFFLFPSVKKSETGHLSTFNFGKFSSFGCLGHST